MKLRFGPYLLTPRDISGGLADLGVLIPLEAGLIAVNGLNPTTTLLGAGVIYILAGWYFRIPMPVQPLKALSVLAIAHQSAPPVIAAAALLMAAALALLSVTRAVSLLERVVPLPVVRGIQIGLGLLLLKSAYQMVFQKPFLLNGLNSSIELGGLSVPAGALLGLGSAALLLLLLRFRSVPAALVVLGIGVGAGLVAAEGLSGWKLGPVPPSLSVPSSGDFWTALVLLVIPQLPLTLANSVIATADTVKAYFGEQARNATPTRIAFSIALGNLWAGLVGGLPNCHGSGGLTAHYRLGARTPLATAFLGVLLIVIALLFGRSAWEVRSLLPAATLGALLFYTGVQHILLGLNLRTTHHLGLALLVAVVSMGAGGNLAIGAGVGLALSWGLRWLSRRYGWRVAEERPLQPVLARMLGALQRVVPAG